MKINQKQQYHGAALAQLVGHDSFKALNNVDDGKYGHYLVNTDRRMLIKHTTEEEGPWQFTFQPDDLATLQADESGFTTFAVLVCGNQTICLLPFDDLTQVIDLNAGSAQWVRGSLPPRSSMRVRGSAGELGHAVAHNAFPAGVFA